MADTTEVVIIGAGAAGLAAAERLLWKKKELVVLEARDRIGGAASGRFTPNRSPFQSSSAPSSFTGPRKK
jgi:monoamine oxidase